MIDLRYPSTARMLDAARVAGVLDPLASMHAQEFVVMHMALMYASREDKGLQPINRGFYVDLDTGRPWKPETRALILGVRINEDWLLPAPADYRCRYSAKPIPVQAITRVEDVTRFRGSPERAQAATKIAEALRRDGFTGVQAAQREILANFGRTGSSVTAWRRGSADVAARQPASHAVIKPRA